VSKNVHDRKHFLANHPVSGLWRRSVDPRRLRRGWDRIVPDMLRVDPHRLTTVREAHDKALDELGKQLDDLLNAGFVRSPWLGDTVSTEVKDHYNRTVMESPLGAYQAMRRYETELMAVRDQFAEMERAYLAAESANADRARQAQT
jgi:hypothetical protein